LLKRHPYGRTKPLVSRTMAKNIVGHGIYQLVILFVLVFVGEQIFDIDSGRYAPMSAPPSQHFTIVFNAFVMMTLFNEINARKIHGERNVFEGFFRNPIFVSIWIATFVSQVIIIEFGGMAFSTTHLEPDQWLWCIVIGAGTIVWGQIITTIPSQRLPRSMTVGRGAVDMSEFQTGDGGLVSAGGGRPRSGSRILWLRGFARIQTQEALVEEISQAIDLDRRRSTMCPADMRVVNAFIAGMDQPPHHRGSIMSPSGKRFQDLARLSAADIRRKSLSVETSSTSHRTPSSGQELTRTSPV